MVDYLYDGTFEGFLTCIHAHYYEEKASVVYEAIERKISGDDLRRVYRVFRSSDEEKENKLLRYIVLGFKEGPGIRLLHSNPVVFEVQQLERKVSFEAHRILGLARFSALKFGGEGTNGFVESKREILYCRLEPDHDILEFIADHFADRLKNEPFIIHDKRRNKAVFAMGGSWYISDFKEEALPAAGSGEKEFRGLWKEYFETIAIKERTNPACQRRFMPVRYWKNLTEMR